MNEWSGGLEVLYVPLNLRGEGRYNSHQLKILTQQLLFDATDSE